MNISCKLSLILLGAVSGASLFAEQPPASPVASPPPASLVGQDVRLPAILGNHMVLQQDTPVPIWGTAAPNSTVTVKFRDQQKSATADAKGKWLLKLDPLKAGGPDKLVINATTIDDVLVGEVWLGSGQSNMEYTASMPGFATDLTLAAMVKETYPQIREFSQTRTGFEWKLATPENNRNFSATLFSFGVPLQKELKVPMGLMVGASGGTPSIKWISEEAYRHDPACMETIKNFEATYPYEELLKKYEAGKAKYDQTQTPAPSDSTSQEPNATGKPAPSRMNLPRPVLKAGELEQPSWTVGMLYESKIRPMIPFAIRGVLWDQGENGTGVTGGDQYVLMGALIKGWRKDWGQGDFPFIYVQKPSGGGPAFDYNNPLATEGDKFVPQPSGQPRPIDPGGFSRERTIAIMKYPNTFMAITSDLGSGLHPRHKSGYGGREALVALAAAYGRKNEIYGPIYQSYTIEGDKLRVKFSHAQGLVFKGGDRLQGFIIAGADQKFYWADAVIDGGTVILSSSSVAKPVAARYAWSTLNPSANLFNQDGLPALTFRTDTWPMPPVPGYPKKSSSSAPPSAKP